MLFRSYVRDKPQLAVNLVYPEVYQWFFKLPSLPLENQPTTKFGFLAYLDISNRGLRDVSVDAWKLSLRPKQGNARPLNPLSISEPKIAVGKSGLWKMYPVLGHAGQASTGSTLVKSGSSISGFAYYVFEYVGGNEWNLIESDRTVTGKVVVTDIFGKSASQNVVFREISLGRALSMVPNIDQVDADMTRTLQG